MTAQRKTLNAKQVDLLLWVRDGCPEGTYGDDHHHRISAAALRRRGFLSISGRGSSWHADLTGAGRDYLNRVEGPDPPTPRQANVSVTQELVDDVIAAGGTLVVPSKSWRDPDSVDYRRRARLAEHLGKFPTGKLFAIRNLDDGDLEIELVSGPTMPGGGKPKPIEVPEQISRYHPAAKSFRDGKDRHEVSREMVQRATRIVHVLSREATARGWVVQAPGRSSDSYGRESWTPSKNGHLVIETKDERFWFRLREGKVRLRGNWEQEVQHHRNVDPDSPWWRDREIPRGPHDANADGKLELVLFCTHY